MIQIKQIIILDKNNEMQTAVFKWSQSMEEALQTNLALCEKKKNCPGVNLWITFDTRCSWGVTDHTLQQEQLKSVTFETSSNEL